MAKCKDHKRVFASDQDKKGKWICRECGKKGTVTNLKEGYRSEIDWINQAFYNELNKEKVSKNQAVSKKQS